MRRYRFALRAYPRDWRDRFGAEVLRLLAALDDEDARRWQGLDLVRAGLAERIHRLRNFVVRHRGASSSIVAFKSAAERAADARRRRAGRWTVAVLPSLILAAGVPYLLRIEHAVPSASVSSSHTIASDPFRYGVAIERVEGRTIVLPVRYRVVDGNRVYFCLNFRPLAYSGKKDGYAFVPFPVGAMAASRGSTISPPAEWGVEAFAVSTEPAKSAANISCLHVATAIVRTDKEVLTLRARASAAAHAVLAHGAIADSFSGA